jgi:hypothetical protein
VVKGAAEDTEESRKPLRHRNLEPEKISTPDALLGSAPDEKTGPRGGKIRRAQF